MAPVQDSGHSQVTVQDDEATTGVEKLPTGGGSVANFFESTE